MVDETEAGMAVGSNTDTAKLAGTVELAGTYTEAFLDAAICTVDTADTETKTIEGLATYEVSAAAAAGTCNEVDTGSTEDAAVAAVDTSPALDCNLDSALGLVPALDPVLDSVQPLTRGHSMTARSPQNSFL